MQIAEHLESIVRLISSNPVVAVVAPTGSGKSIGIPAAIAATDYTTFVSVPTRTAAFSLSEYQHYLLQGAQIPDYVGYAAEGEIKYNRGTKIVYATSGHVRRKMLSYFKDGIASPINFCDVLFIDEAHSGSLDNYIITSLWKYAAQTVQVPRLVIASATMTISGPLFKLLENFVKPYVYEVKITAFPIDLRYFNKDPSITEALDQLHKDTAELAVKVHKSSVEGDMLIFASGKNEVEGIVKLITDTKSDKLIIVPAYSNMSREDINKMYEPTPPGYRKVIVATNIAETSITISDLGVVIDTLTEKVIETTLSGGSRLILKYISKSSGIQRMGRTGRTRRGICYRMCTPAFFEKLSEQRKEEIERIPVYNSVMEILDIGLDPKIILTDLPKNKLQHSINLLEQLGMITESGVVTEIGHFSTEFPLGVRLTAVLYRWYRAGNPLFPGIVLCAMVDSFGPPYFFYPRKRSEISMSDYRMQLDKHIDEYFNGFRGRSDLDTLINIWNDLIDTLQGLNHRPKDLLEWCQRNSMNHKKIREIFKIVQACVTISMRLGMLIKVGPFTTEGLIKAIRPIIAEVYSDRVFKQGKVPSVYWDMNTKEHYNLDSRQSVNNLSNPYPPYVVALITTEFGGRNTPVRVITCALDLEERPKNIRKLKPIVPEDVTLPPISERGSVPPSKYIPPPRRRETKEEMVEQEEKEAGVGTESLEGSLDLLKQLGI